MTIDPNETAALNALWGRLLVEELVRQGVTPFCVCPGSRSTPLAIAVAECAGAEFRVHFDERGAAYYALGLAKANGRPAAIVCTSGTAAANFFPAVIEASASLTPLVVLTADRPPELLDAGANQTVDQTKIYGSYVRWQAALPCPDPAIPVSVVLTTAAQAAYRARRAPSGPVHVNCLFREPLVGPISQSDRSPLGPIGKPGPRTPFTRYLEPETRCDAQVANVLEPILNARRGVLMVGALARPADRIAAEHLAETLRWPVFPDVMSGLRLGAAETPFVPYYDQVLPGGFREGHAPDAIVQLGSPFVSKRLLQAVARTTPDAYVVVADHPFRHDPAHAVSHRIEAPIDAFCEALRERLMSASCRADEDWLAWWRGASQAAGDAIATFIDGRAELTEPGVARRISKRIAPGSAVFLGNSMPIRDMDMFAAPDGPRVPVCANRGASGIDGTLATAAGFASGLGSPVTAILGDQALLHDLNSIALFKRNDVPVTVVAVNNRGGGIFSFLPVAQHAACFERFFAAPHNCDFERIAAMFGVAYARPKTVAAFDGAYDAMAGRPGIIEIATSREENADFHRALWEEIVRFVAGS